MGACMLVTITFLALLLPTMILVVLLNLIPPLRRNRAITYGIVALLVILVTVWASSLDEYGLLRSLAGALTLSVLAADYKRTVRSGARGE
jgi:hypothetical protein